MKTNLVLALLTLGWFASSSDAQVYMGERSSVLPDYYSGAYGSTGMGRMPGYPVVVATEDAAVPISEQLPGDARELVKHFEAEKAAIQKAAEKKIREERQKLIEKLKPLQDKYTRDAKLDEAVAIRDLIRALKQPVENVLPDPGALHYYGSLVGRVLHFRVTGQVGGSIWGTDVYTGDSALGVAAVHAGVLKPGQTGLVKVTIVPGRSEYQGSARHGVSSMSYGSYAFSYKVEPIRGDDRAEAQEGDKSCQVLLDSFDGRLSLPWKPIRPDATHVSLDKHPGKLTIVTQRGSIHGNEKQDEYGGGIQAKNIFVLDNPFGNPFGGGDFQMTTCVEGFTPQTQYQQAGLICYDDDDNYLKFGYEWNWQEGSGHTFTSVREVDQESNFDLLDAKPGINKFWLRIAKHGSTYRCSFSYDGEKFVTVSEQTWGKGNPKKLGFLAKNGGNPEASELECQFDFFELRG